MNAKELKKYALVSAIGNSEPGSAELPGLFKELAGNDFQVAVEMWEYMLTTHVARLFDIGVSAVLEGAVFETLQKVSDVKLKASLEPFFAGLKLAAAYSIIGAVISEWLGGSKGLGVYMTRVRKAYAFDKMFAVIILISLVSLLLMKFIEIIQNKSMPWKGDSK